MIETCHLSPVIGIDSKFRLRRWKSLVKKPDHLEQGVQFTVNQIEAERIRQPPWNDKGDYHDQEPNHNHPDIIDNNILSWLQSSPWHASAIIRSTNILFGEVPRHPSVRQCVSLIEIATSDEIHISKEKSNTIPMKPEL